jgi:hypothetical protein
MRGSTAEPAALVARPSPIARNMRIKTRRKRISCPSACRVFGEKETSPLPEHVVLPLHSGALQNLSVATGNQLFLDRSSANLTSKDPASGRHLSVQSARGVRAEGPVLE